MPSFDLTGVNWNKIDPYALHMLRDPLKDVIPFSGTREEWVQMAVANELLSGRTIGFLIRLKEDINWPDVEIPGIVFRSRIGRIISAQGTFETLLALAKDEHVQFVEASRPLSFEEVTI